MKAFGIAALVAALGLPSVALANDDDDANRADVRCLLGMTFLMRSPQYKEAGGAGTLYFAGLIEGRDPTFDLKGALKREVGRMSPNDYMEEARRCGVRLKEKNDALKAAGDSLKN